MSHNYWKTEAEIIEKKAVLGLMVNRKNTINGIRQKVCRHSRSGDCGLLRVEPRLKPGQPLPLGLFHWHCVRRDLWSTECMHCAKKSSDETRERAERIIYKAMDQLERQGRG